MQRLSELIAPLISGSGVHGHGNQSANFSGNHMQLNASVGLKSHQTVIQKAPDGLSPGSSLLLAAGAAAVGAAAAAFVATPDQRALPGPQDDKRLAGQKSAHSIAKEVMGNGRRGF